MRFSDIPGLKAQKDHLIEAYNNQKVAHAQLFKGNEGSSNLTMALAFATYLNCTDKQTNDSCGRCPSCIKSDKLIHPDLHFSFPVASTAKISKSSDLISQKFLKLWREAISQNNFLSIEDWLNHIGAESKQANISKEESRQIIKSLSLKAFEGEYKIMIIWLPEFMHPSAANGLLKILEEPPEKTVFLLVSTDPDKLLGTIISRVQAKSIPLFNKEELEGFLIQNHGLDQKKAGEIARISDGNVNQAVKLINHVEDENHQNFQQWLRNCYSKAFGELVSDAESFHKMTKVSQKGYISYGLNVLRETLLARSGIEVLNKVQDDELKFVQNLGKTLSIEAVESISHIFNEALYHLERNASPKILFLDVSIKTSQILRSA
ncbi:MAG: DNA polymerase III subunit delta [Bacteroidota bacterium]